MNHLEQKGDDLGQWSNRKTAFRLLPPGSCPENSFHFPILYYLQVKVYSHGPIHFK